MSFKKNIISDQQVKSGNRSVEKPGLVLVSSSGADKSGFTNRKGGVRINKNRVAIRIQMLFRDEGVVLNLLVGHRFL